MHFLYIRTAIQSIIPILAYPMILSISGSAIFSELIFAIYLGTLISIIIQFGFNLSGHRDATKYFTQNNLESYLVKTIMLRMMIATFFSLGVVTLNTILPEALNAEQIIIMVIIFYSTSIDNTWYLEWKREFKLMAGISLLSVSLLFLLFNIIKSGSASPSHHNMLIAILLSLPVAVNAIGSLAFTWVSLDGIKINKLKIVKMAMASQAKIVGVNFIMAAYGASGVLVMSHFITAEDISRYVLLEKYTFGLIGLLSLPLTRHLRELSSIADKNDLFKSKVNIIFKKSLLSSFGAACIFFIFLSIAKANSYFPFMPNLSSIALAALLITIGISMQFNNVVSTLIGVEKTLIVQNLLIISLLIVFGGLASYMVGVNGWISFLIVSNILAMLFLIRNINNGQADI